MAENLKIIIDADVSGLARGASEATKATGQIAKEAQKSAKILQGDFSKGANTASASVINLSRVVQDAPYAFTTGFGSIANNIDPLFESFRRLKTETGSTSAAFSSLGKSLLGGAGIGLAISLATSLITSFSLGLFSAKKATKDVQDALDGLAKKVATDVTQLTALVGLAKNLNASYEDRVKAVKAINQEYSKYLYNLEGEKASLENIDKAYQAITDSILRQAVVKGLQAEISSIVEKYAKQIIELEKAEAQRAKKQKDLTDLQKVSTKLTNEQVASLQKLKSTNPNLTDEQISLLQRGVKGQAQYNKALSDGYGQAVKQQTVTQGQIIAFGSYEDSLARLKKLLYEEILPLQSVTSKFEELGITLDKVKPDNSLEKALKAIKDELNGIVNSSALFTTPDFLDPRKLTQLELLIKNGLAIGDLKIIPNDITLDKELNLKVASEFNKLFDEIGVLRPEINFELAPSVNERELERSYQKALKSSSVIAKRIASEFNKELPKVFEKLQEGVLTALGQGIGDALSGGGFKSLFTSLFNLLGTVLQQLGETLISLGIGLKAIKEALTSLKPGVAIAAGVGLLALGAIIKNSVGKIGAGLAEGGIVPSGFPNDTFPARLTSGEAVIPLNRLEQMMAANNSGGGGSRVSRIRGRDILLVESRTRQSQSRLVGRVA